MSNYLRYVGDFPLIPVFTNTQIRPIVTKVGISVHDEVYLLQLCAIELGLGA
jgi:hypothetical protein